MIAALAPEMRLCNPTPSHLFGELELKVMSGLNARNFGQEKRYSSNSRHRELSDGAVAVSTQCDIDSEIKAEEKTTKDRKTVLDRGVAAIIEDQYDILVTLRLLMRMAVAGR
jgi:hypothetical protein